MTVAELIEKLQAAPQDATVVVAQYTQDTDADYYAPVDRVRIDSRHPCFDDRELPAVPLILVVG